MFTIILGIKYFCATNSNLRSWAMYFGVRKDKLMGRKGLGPIGSDAYV